MVKEAKENISPFFTKVAVTVVSMIIVFSIVAAAAAVTKVNVVEANQLNLKENVYDDIKEMKTKLDSIDANIRLCKCN